MGIVKLYEDQPALFDRPCLYHLSLLPHASDQKEKMRGLPFRGEIQIHSQSDHVQPHVRTDLSNLPHL